MHTTICILSGFMEAKILKGRIKFQFLQFNRIYILIIERLHLGQYKY